MREALAGVVDRLAEILPGFGETVAIDSTVVRTHSNPKRRVISDADASWTAKPDARGEREFHFGYKYHLLSDAVYGIPVVGITTTARRNDTLLLPPLLELARKTHSYLAPAYVVADKGYDSEANHQAIYSTGAVPVIPIRRSTGGVESDPGVFDEAGRLTCLGGQTMVALREDPERGTLWRCPPQGCHLQERRGVRHCSDQLWDKPEWNRQRGPLARSSPEWSRIYGLRASIERLFKGAKQNRRLGTHYVRGLRQIALHTSMSMLAFAATSLAHIMRQEQGLLRWQVRKIA